MTTRTFGFFGLLAVSLAAISPASAQSSEANPFVISDRTWDRSSAGVDIGATMDLDDTDFVAIRLDAHLEHLISPQLGVLASLPIAYVLGDGEDLSGIANLDVGGFFVAGTPDRRILLRGSVMLPTASDSFEGLIANLTSSIARLNDLIGAAPNLVVGRVGGSLILRQPELVIRLDGGADVPITSTEDNDNLDRDPIFHVGASVAVGPPGGNRFVAELANLFNSEASAGEDFLHQLSAGLSMDRGSGSLFIGASTLLDALLEDGDGVPLSFLLSYRHHYGR